MKIIDGKNNKLAWLFFIEPNKIKALIKPTSTKPIDVAPLFFCKTEKGERRLDIVEFFLHCNSLKIEPAHVALDMQKKEVVADV
ncbi:hypothetical protein [Pseudomonas sp. QD4]|uniref:hypothetical protein n=1 Tax=Pseudomonas sp. QD4 TaxID=3368618 RepID=UPI003B9F138B